MSRFEPEPEHDARQKVWLAMDAVTALAAEVAEIGHGFLSLQERARLSALGAHHDRLGFLAGRLLLRRLLARVHGGDALTDWPLSAEQDDAPAFLGQAFVARPAAAWQMSVGHGGAFVACAVASGRIAVDLQMAADECEAALVLGEVNVSPQELLNLRDMDDDERADYFMALRALHEAAVKCEAARATPDMLRLLAQGGISPKQWAAIASASSGPSDSHPPDVRGAGPVAARGWTWHGDGSTLAVVSPDMAASPRWALPPPAFALQAPVEWSLFVASDPLP